MHDTARSIAREMCAHTTHRALALRLLRHTLLRVGVEFLRVLDHVRLGRRDLLDDTLREGVLASGLTASVKLLFVKQDRLGVMMLLVGSHVGLRLVHARTADSVEFMNLHLGWLRQIVRLVVMLDWDIAHWLTYWLLPQLLLRLLVVIRHVASLSYELHGNGAVGATAAGWVAVLACGVESLPDKLLRPLWRIVQAHFSSV